MTPTWSIDFDPIPSIFPISHHIHRSHPDSQVELWNRNLFSQTPRYPIKISSYQDLWYVSLSFTCKWISPEWHLSHARSKLIERMTDLLWVQSSVGISDVSIIMRNEKIVVRYLHDRLRRIKIISSMSLVKSGKYSEAYSCVKILIICIFSKRLSYWYYVWIDPNFSCSCPYMNGSLKINNTHDMQTQHMTFSKKDSYRSLFTKLLRQ